MNNNSVQQLSEKLKLKQQQDRQQVEELIRNELTELTQNFNTQLHGVLDTTLSGIRQGLQSVSTLSQQLQSDYHDQNEENQNKFRNYLMVSGLFHFVALVLLAGVLFWFHKSLVEQIPPSTPPPIAQITQQERRELDTLLRYKVRIIHSRQGEGFLLFPEGAQKPEAFLSPTFPGQWLLHLDASSATIQR